MRPYTPKQRAILEFIAVYQTEHAVSPTLEEIGEHFGVHRVTVFQHVGALERRGALRRRRQMARSIEILDPEFRPREGLEVLGHIAAGAPIEALEHPEILDADDVLPDDGEHYALRVRGDSMIEDAICNGDLVIVRRTSQARNGQVVVAVLPDNEATLKRYYLQDDGRVRLQPANAALEPLVVDDVTIRGVVTSVLRQL